MRSVADERYQATDSVPVSTPSSLNATAISVPMRGRETSSETEAFRTTESVEPSAETVQVQSPPSAIFGADANVPAGNRATTYVVPPGILSAFRIRTSAFAGRFTCAEPVTANTPPVAMSFASKTSPCVAVSAPEEISPTPPTCAKDAATPAAHSTDPPASTRSFAAGIACATLSFSTPASTRVAPVYVFRHASSSVPAPFFTRPPPTCSASLTSSCTSPVRAAFLITAFAVV